MLFKLLDMWHLFHLDNSTMCRYLCLLLLLLLLSLRSFSRLHLFFLSLPLSIDLLIDVCLSV